MIKTQRGYLRIRYVRGAKIITPGRSHHFVFGLVAIVKCSVLLAWLTFSSHGMTYVFILGRVCKWGFACRTNKKRLHVPSLPISTNDESKQNIIVWRVYANELWGVMWCSFESFRIHKTIGLWLDFATFTLGWNEKAHLDFSTGDICRPVRGFLFHWKILVIKLERILNQITIADRQQNFKVPSRFSFLFQLFLQ